MLGDFATILTVSGDKSHENWRGPPCGGALRAGPGMEIESNSVEGHSGRGMFSLQPPHRVQDRFVHFIKAVSNM